MPRHFFSRLALLALLLASGPALAATPVDAFFAGRVVDLDGRRITLHYDFSSQRQMADFELVQPPGLWKVGEPRFAWANNALSLKATGAFAHKAVSNGVVRARATVILGHRRDQGPLMLGGDEAFLCADLFDRRFEDKGGLFFSVCLPAQKRGPDDTEPLKWRALAKRSAADVARRFPAGKEVEVELGSEGDRHELRLGELMIAADSTGRAPAMGKRRFGWWVRNAGVEIRSLTLTLDLDPEYVQRNGIELNRRADVEVAGLSSGKLNGILRKQSLSPAAAAAARKIARTGDKGLKKLGSLARKHLRKGNVDAARPILRALARGADEPELRRELLEKLWPKKGQLDIGLALAPHLLRWFEPNRARLVAALGSRRPDVRELFFELVRRGLTNEEIADVVAHPVLGPYAENVLRDREVAVPADADRARRDALEAHSPVAARAMLEDFARTPDWDYVVRLIDLLAEKDAKVARGAHLLLMTLSGKDLAPDRDFWLSWMSAQKDLWKRPKLSSPGLATAAILRGRDFLLADLAEDGVAVWPAQPEPIGTRVGATALAVTALRVAGVPANHPALQKALRETLLVDGVAMRDDIGGYTYGLANLALALRALDPKKHIEPLKAIAGILARGQLKNGQWTYFCKDPRYAPEARLGVGDNSNTQYAILALRACWRSGVDVPEKVWRDNLAFWQKARSARGGWGYGPSGSTHHELSMTAAGVATMAICMEALHGNDVTRLVKGSKRVGAGLVRLGELLLEDHYDDSEIYAMYGVERAAILTGVKSFADFDWYDVGATKLVREQKESGAWGDPLARGVATGRGYGEAVDTAYALLFLKRATTGLPGADGGGVVEIPREAHYKRKRAVKKKRARPGD